MMRFRVLWSSLATRLVVVMVATPLGLAIGFIVHLTSLAGAERRAAEERALAISGAVAAQNRMHLQGVETLLTTLARDPSLRDGDDGACAARLAVLENLLAPFGYSGLAVLDEEGDVSCAGNARHSLLNQSARLDFANAVASQQFSFGGYWLSATDAEPTFGTALPITDGAGDVLVVGISTAWLSRLIEGMSNDDVARVELIDSNGTLVAQYPDGPLRQGASLVGTAIFETIESRDRGLIHVDDNRGSGHVIGFVPVDEQFGKLTVAAYIAEPSILFLLAKRETIIYIAASIIIVFGVIIVIFDIQFSIFANIDRLLKVTRNLADGNLAARVGLVNYAGEFGALAGHFDEMASTLENRDLRIQRDTRRLQNVNHDLEHFAYIASHDLRAPLRGIASLVEWIEEDLDGMLSDESRHNMHRLRARVSRLDELMDALLQYSRAGRTQEQQVRVDTAELVDDAAALLDPPDGFAVEVAAGMPVLTTSRAALQTVFSNLISNALQHHDRDQGHVTVAAGERDGITEFVVSDDGPGIPERSRERIFDIFQTLKAPGETGGTGIGLAIVKRLVEAHGGTVDVDTTDGVRGTTFRFTWGASRDYA